MRRLTISVEEAAQVLGIGRSLAYQMARQGQLPGAVRLGEKRFVVSVAALQGFLQVDHCAEGEPEFNLRPNPLHVPGATEARTASQRTQDHVAESPVGTAATGSTLDSGTALRGRKR